MNLTAAQKSLIERIVNVFETGTPDGDYAAITIFNDGPHNMPQITYGRSQTTEFGNLGQLVRMYADANGRFSDLLRPFASRVGQEILTDNAEFKGLLRSAGREDPVMRRIQDQFFDQAYFQPAMQWADNHQFTLPLSALVIYDSFIHSGRILSVIRNTFPEVTPDQGGSEKLWITAYINARQNFLAGSHRAVVRRTVYRTKCLMDEANRENWDLSLVPVIANGVKVSPAA